MPRARAARRPAWSAPVWPPLKTRTGLIGTTVHRTPGHRYTTAQRYAIGHPPGRSGSFGAPRTCPRDNATRARTRRSAGSRGFSLASWLLDRRGPVYPGERRGEPHRPGELLERVVVGLHGGRVGED